MTWLALEEPPPGDPVSPATPALPPTRRRFANASFVLHHQADAVLLHLKDERNYVTLQVMNATGLVVQTTRADLLGGFHELILMNRSTRPALHAFRLIINQEVITFSAVL